MSVYSIEPPAASYEITAAATDIVDTIPDAHPSKVQTYTVDTDGSYELRLARDDTDRTFVRTAGQEYIGRLKRFSSGPASAIITIGVR